MGPDRLGCAVRGASTADSGCVKQGQPGKALPTCIRRPTVSLAMLGAGIMYFLLLFK